MYQPVSYFRHNATKKTPGDISSLSITTVACFCYLAHLIYGIWTHKRVRGRLYSSPTEFIFSRSTTVSIIERTTPQIIATIIPSPGKLSPSSSLQCILNTKSNSSGNPPNAPRRFFFNSFCQAIIVHYKGVRTWIYQENETSILRLRTWYPNKTGVRRVRFGINPPNSTILWQTPFINGNIWCF